MHLMLKRTDFIRIVMTHIRKKKKKWENLTVLSMEAGVEKQDLSMPWTRASLFPEKKRVQTPGCTRYTMRRLLFLPGLRMMWTRR